MKQLEHTKDRYLGKKLQIIWMSSHCVLSLILTLYKGSSKEGKHSSFALIIGSVSDEAYLSKKWPGGSIRSSTKPLGVTEASYY